MGQNGSSAERAGWSPQRQHIVEEQRTKAAAGYGRRARRETGRSAGSRAGDGRRGPAPGRRRGPWPARPPAWPVLGPARQPSPELRRVRCRHADFGHFLWDQTLHQTRGGSHRRERTAPRHHRISQSGVLSREGHGSNMRHTPTEWGGTVFTHPPITCFEPHHAAKRGRHAGDRVTEQLPAVWYDAGRGALSMSQNRRQFVQSAAGLGLAAAAVVVVGLLLGSQLLGSPTNLGGPGDPTATPEASATSESTPEPSTAGHTRSGSWGPTRYRIRSTVPFPPTAISGWTPRIRR